MMGDVVIGKAGEEVHEGEYQHTHSQGTHPNDRFKHGNPHQERGDRDMDLLTGLATHQLCARSYGWTVMYSASSVFVC